MAPVYRFLEYRRALWLQQGQNLERIFRDAWSTMPMSSQRIIQRKDGSSVMGLRVFDFGARGIGIHCGKYVEQQPVGVVPMIDADTVVLSERRPGNNENFLETDFLLLLWGDHVVSLNAGQGAASARTYLHGIFQAANLPDESRQFDIVRIASAAEMRRVEASGGAERIQLDLSIEEATESFLTTRRTRGWGMDDLTAPLKRLMHDLVGSDQRASQIAASKKGNLRLSISVPNGDLTTAKNGINGIAQILVEDENADDYVIFLRNGDSIRPSEIAVKKRIRLDRVANTVGAEAAMSEMNVFMAELEASGQLRA